MDIISLLKHNLSYLAKKLTSYTLSSLSHSFFIIVFSDFNDVMKLEPDNKQAKQELEIIKKKVIIFKSSFFTNHYMN